MTPGAKTSSSWSTRRTVRIGVRATASASLGPARPGDTTLTSRPAARSDAAIPARSRDDFPLPDGPTTASTPRSCRSRRHAAVSVSRPQNDSRSSTSYDVSPGHGQVVRLAGRGRHEEVGILQQDRLLERSRLRTRVDPQLVDEAAHGADGASRAPRPAPPSGTGPARAARGAVRAAAARSSAPAPAAAPRRAARRRGGRRRAALRRPDGPLADARPRAPPGPSRRGPRAVHR